MIRQIISARRSRDFEGAGSNPLTGGDYSMTTIDPSDGMTFWHANEYYWSGLETTSASSIFKAGHGLPTYTDGNCNRNGCFNANASVYSFPAAAAHTVPSTDT